MIETDSSSDTFQPVGDDLDFNGPFSAPLLLMSTATARIYRISKAGKRMLLKTPIDDSGWSLALLKREYTLAVGLDHPNVATIFTWASRTPVGPGILMEYVDGRTLVAFLAEKPSLHARRRVFRQLLDAVSYIHKHGVTHNDLKPGNIMVSRTNDDVKIIDFGLADGDCEAVMRQLGMTPGYASPELSVRNPLADARSDIFSIGVIMQEIFGHRYRSIWKKCTAENPQKRYRNIDDLAVAWRRRQRLPLVLGTLGIAIAISMVVAFGIVKIGILSNDMKMSTQTTRHMADTISALRQSQLEADDSISHLNHKLYQINRSKSELDSMTQAYMASSRRVIEKYKDITRHLRCIEESYHMYKLYNAEMDCNDSTFLSCNPILGRDIYDKYGVSTRLQGTTEIEKLAKGLPMLQDLTPDLDEQMRVLSLIQSGKPWELKVIDN